MVVLLWVIMMRKAVKMGAGKLIFKMSCDG